MAFSVPHPALMTHRAAHARPRGLASQAAGGARTEIVDAAAFLAREAEFHALAEASPEANAFLEPAMLDAAQRADPSVPIIILLAWEDGAEDCMIGAWAFARRTGLFERLHAPAVPFGTLATPVIRPGWTETVLAAWLAHLDAERAMPKLLELTPVDATGPVGLAIDRLVAARRCSRHIVARHHRPMLESNLDADTYLRQAVSGSRRSKLRQLRAKLGRKGALRRVVHEGGAVPGATEQFLTLEARGWKGRRGSAIVVNPARAAFVRGMLGALSERGCAAISALTLDERPVSMCVLLRSGRTAYTWKIAYDEAVGACSPGYQLALDDTAMLLADPAIARTDSCAAGEIGIMSELWRERAESVDVFLGVPPGGGARFKAVMAALTVIRLVPELRRRLQLRSRLKAIIRTLRVGRRR